MNDNDSGQPIVENKSAGQLYPTERVSLAAVLKAAGHKVYRYTIAPGPRPRLVFHFPMIDPRTGTNVHDTIRAYTNNELPVDAKTLVDTWMEFRDLTRNKEFAVGQST